MVSGGSESGTTLVGLDLAGDLDIICVRPLLAGVGDGETISVGPVFSGDGERSSVGPVLSDAGDAISVGPVSAGDGETSWVGPVVSGDGETIWVGPVLSGLGDSICVGPVSSGSNEISGSGTLAAAGPARKDEDCTELRTRFAGGKRRRGTSDKTLPLTATSDGCVSPASSCRSVACVSCV